MLAFACPSCGKSLRVRDELAGKKVKCPGCQQPVAVRGHAPLPAGQDEPTLPPRPQGQQQHDNTNLGANLHPPTQAFPRPDATRTVIVDEEVRREFEAAWQAGKPVRIEDFLANQPVSHPLATLEELVHIDLEFQWKTWSENGGKPKPLLVEKYLARFPKLNQPDIVQRLVEQEFRVRQHFGSPAGIAEYQSRFPKVDLRHLEARQESSSAEIVEAGGHYQISSEIARGGMGAIMRAVDQDIHREVAVKFLLNHSDSHQKARFIEEAQITGQLEHPNIVPIHQLGVHEDGRCFFSMKMVKGRSLADILKQQREPGASAKLQGEPGASATGEKATLGQLLTIFAGVCNGMAYAHSRQVIHRDLKPANIMVGDFGEVYVMDWGLAKVLNEPEASATVGRKTAGSVAHASGSSDSGNATDSQTDSKVTTNRSSTGELTQAGSIMGTPAYMSPEQAQGDPDRIDERTDIYALGAILYEILTLTPPVGRGGDIASVLMRVIDGKIDPPEERAPERVKAGRIPPELSAIAMKALSKKRKDRYQTVAELQRDIQLFQEGRSVSAKQDTIREMAVKLIKRNKGVSIATAVATVVLLIFGTWSLVTILGAYDELVSEQKAKREQAVKSLPSLVRAAKLLINELQMDDALVQLDAALDIDERLAEARLLKGQVLLTRQQFAEASSELEKYLTLDPGNDKVKNVMKLAQAARRDAIDHLLGLANELNQQKAFAVASHLTQRAEQLLAPRQELLMVYQKRLEAAWPGFGSNLTLKQDGDIQLHIPYPTFDNLSPLAGMPINHLALFGGGKIRDLSPLKGLPLKTLNLSGCTNVADLAPLAGLPLVELDISSTKVTTLTHVAQCPLEILKCQGPISDLGPLKRLHLRQLHLSSCPVTDLTPLKGMPLTGLNIYACQVKDLAPLRGMPLEWLDMHEGCQSADLSPLKGMPLKSLWFGGSGVPFVDLSALQGMPLEALDMYQCGALTTLEPLRGLPLKYLSMSTNLVTDLRPLEKAPLQTLVLMDLKLHDLNPLKGLPLTKLHIACPEVENLAPLRGMPLKELNLNSSTKIRDLTPLAGMKLTYFYFPPNATKGIEEIRAMKTSLVRINDIPAQEFWKKWDAAKGKGK